MDFRHGGFFTAERRNGKWKIESGKWMPENNPLVFSVFHFPFSASSASLRLNIYCSLMRRAFAAIASARPPFGTSPIWMALS